MLASSKAVDFREVIGSLDVLPAMPIIAQKLLSLDLGTTRGEREMLLLIEQDPQISAKIIGLANSAAVATSRKVTTVKDATMLLGFGRAQSVASGIAIISLMAKVPSGRFNMQDLWLHSLGVAFSMLALSRAMPARLRPQEDLIFLAGMLHDIGYLVLAFLKPELSDKLHERLAAAPVRALPEIEQELLGIGHAELGAELARHWGLPEEIIAVLRYHHTPQAAAEQTLAQMIAVVEKLLPSFGLNEHIVGGVTDAEWQALGIDPGDAAEVNERVIEQAEQASQFASALSY